MGILKSRNPERGHGKDGNLPSDDGKPRKGEKEMTEIESKMLARVQRSYDIAKSAEEGTSNRRTWMDKFIIEAAFVLEITGKIVEVENGICVLR